MIFRRRTATHSLVIWGALFAFALLLWLFVPAVPTTALLIAMGITAGCFLHILGDLMTTAPVRGALFPIGDKIFWILPRFMRFTVGSPLESVYFILFSIALGAFGAMVGSELIGEIGL
jgi:membrane-bound metal-dependent hydrolase YbcI (DUF457 family)